MYNIENLKEINRGYAHTIVQSDVDMVNNYISIIENSRNENIPQIGDIVEYTTKHGDYYKNGHIDNYYSDTNNYYICEKPYVPFISLNKDKNNIICSTSGGAWTEVNRNKFKYIGKRLKTFCDWGSWGAGANCAVYFQAMVSVWEYIEEGQKYPYTTKTHNKYYISILTDEAMKNRNSNYKYIGDGFAFINDEEFKAWLKCFKGEVFNGNWENQIVVWTYKNIKKHWVDDKEFNQIEGIKDIELCNGNRICKRVYDDNNYTVTTYISNNEVDWKVSKRYQAFY